MYHIFKSVYLAQWFCKLACNHKVQGSSSGWVILFLAWTFFYSTWQNLEIRNNSFTIEYKMSSDIFMIVRYKMLSKMDLAGTVNNEHFYGFLVSVSIIVKLLSAACKPCIKLYFKHSQTWALINFISLSRF